MINEAAVGGSREILTEVCYSRGNDQFDFGVLPKLKVLCIFIFASVSKAGTSEDILAILELSYTAHRVISQRADYSDLQMISAAA